MLSRQRHCARTRRNGDAIAADEGRPGNRGSGIPSLSGTNGHILENDFPVVIKFPRGKWIQIWPVIGL